MTVTRFGSSAPHSVEGDTVRLQQEAGGREGPRQLAAWALATHS